MQITVLRFENNSLVTVITYIQIHTYYTKNVRENRRGNHLLENDSPLCARKTCEIIVALYDLLGTIIERIQSIKFALA